MTQTTIKVEAEVRDRLREVAQRRHVTLGTLLDQVSRKLERQEKMRRVRDDYQRLQHGDPEGFAEYLAEGLAWERATVADGLPDEPFGEYEEPEREPERKE
jgi:hypothetical protein